ncbi:MAG: glycosyltransferase, partial [Clostridia bacterium]|nr:glycosyltransferase [Clostridia bacterium]
FPCEILFSDDGSTDDCAAIVEKTARELALTGVDIRVVRADKNRGKGHAVRLGMQAAQGELCLFTDCDLAYGTDIIPAMANRMSSSPADVLIGSRAIAEDGYAGYTLARKLASKAYVRLLALSAGFRYTDSQCGIKLFRKEAAKKIFSLAETDGWAFDFELLLLADKLGCKIEEYPVKVLNHRESKIHLISDSLKMAEDVRKIKKRIEKSE